MNGVTGHDFGQKVVICERFGWTFEQYDSTDAHDLESLIEFLGAMTKV